MGRAAARRKAPLYYGGSAISSGGLPIGQIAGGIMNFGAHDTLCRGYLGDA